MWCQDFARRANEDNNYYCCGRLSSDKVFSMRTWSSLMMDVTTILSRWAWGKWRELRLFTDQTGVYLGLRLSLVVPCVIIQYCHLNHLFKPCKSCRILNVPLWTSMWGTIRHFSVYISSVAKIAQTAWSCKCYIAVSRSRTFVARNFPKTSLRCGLRWTMQLESEWIPVQLFANCFANSHRSYISTTQLACCYNDYEAHCELALLDFQLLRSTWN